MRHGAFILTMGLMLLTAAGLSTAQTATGNGGGYKAVADGPQPCQREIARFEEALGYVRTSNGERAAAELREKLLPAKLEQELLMTQGVCGLARHLRDNKLSR